MMRVMYSRCFVNNQTLKYFCAMVVETRGTERLGDVPKATEPIGIRVVRTHDFLTPRSGLGS